MRRARHMTWLARLVLVVPVALLVWAVVSELVAGAPAAESPPAEAAIADTPGATGGLSASEPRTADAAEAEPSEEPGATATQTGPAEEDAPAEPAPHAIEDDVPDPSILEQYAPEWSRYRLLDIAVWQFAAAFLLVLLGMVARKVSDYILQKRIVPLLERTRVEFDNLVVQAVSKPLGWVLLLAGVAAAVWVLALPTEPTNVRRFAFAVLKVLLVADLLWFLFRFVDVVAVYLARLAGRTESTLDDHLIPLIRKSLKATIGLLLAVWVVQLLGYNISSLLAGLGVGGLAVALALQDTLANFFGSVFILLDRPFMVGDMVEIEGTQGTVEQIGFRSTRIRTWPATLVSIPNKTVASTKIDNWSRMPKRRVFQTVGVTYETTAEQMEQAVAAIRAVLEADDGVDQDFIVVRFDDFGASSLDIRVYYFTKAVPYADHLETKERINLAIMRAVRGMGLSIAFPTQTVYFEGDVAERIADRLGGKSETGNRKSP
ncbi:MAG: mechanosensitive ion channel family protein [Planctomycetota bacterium]|nr:mechanosensitive ion channel family protein [Planctomycetota bacterium]